MKRTLIVVLLVCALLAGDPASAWPQGIFDGAWNVTVVCKQAPDGALPYTWSFTAAVRTGMLMGNYRAPGTIPSGTLSGQIDAAGNAILSMRGLTGKPDYSVDRVHPGSPFAYTVTAHFTVGHGSGRRNELRECSLDFDKR